GEAQLQAGRRTGARQTPTADAALLLLLGGRDRGCGRRCRRGCGCRCGRCRGRLGDIAIADVTVGVLVADRECAAAAAATFAAAGAAGRTAVGVHGAEAADGEAQAAVT